MTFESTAEAPSEPYAFEPELVGPAPRPIPPRVRQGRRARKQRTMVRWLVAIGVVCGLVGSLPWIDTWSTYVPFLPYVFWIGAGLLAWAAWIWVWERVGPVPTRYIEKGVPLAGTVVDLAAVPSVSQYGQAVSFCYQAMVQYRHPLTGETMAAEIRSSDFSADHLDQYDVTFRVGDQVTLVYLPDDPDGSLRLYGFLDLVPDLGLVCVDEAQRRRNVLAFALVFAAILAVPLLGLVTISLYWPIEEKLAELVWPFGVGVVVFGTPLVAWFLREHRKAVRKQHERNLEAVTSGKAVQVGSTSVFAQTGVLGRFYQLVLLAGSLFCGGLVAVCLAMVLNARLDDGEPAEMPMEVVDLYEESFVFLARVFYLELRQPGSEATHKHYTSPSALEPFFVADQAIARVRPGRFGWPWIESVEPVMPDREADAPGAADEPGEPTP